MKSLHRLRYFAFHKRIGIFILSSLLLYELLVNIEAFSPMRSADRLVIGKAPDLVEICERNFMAKPILLDGINLLQEIARFSRGYDNLCNALSQKAEESMLIIDSYRCSFSKTLYCVLFRDPQGGLFLVDPQKRGLYKPGFAGLDLVGSFFPVENEQR